MRDRVAPPLRRYESQTFVSYEGAAFLFLYQIIFNLFCSQVRYINISRFHNFGSNSPIYSKSTVLSTTLSYSQKPSIHRVLTWSIIFIENQRVDFYNDLFYYIIVVVKDFEKQIHRGGVWNENIGI